MTISLEHVEPGDWLAVERNRQTLQALVMDVGGRSVGIRFGTDTWTWPGGNARSNQKVTTHGLGRTPVAVFVIGATLNGLNETAAGETGTWTSTTFTSQAGLVQGFAPGAGATNTFSWLVIG